MWESLLSFREDSSPAYTKDSLQPLLGSMLPQAKGTLPDLRVRNTSPATCPATKGSEPLGNHEAPSPGYLQKIISK